MTAYTTPYTFSSGTTIQSAQVNANFAYIAAFFNTPSIDNANIKSGAAIALDKLDLTSELPILRSASQRCVSVGNTGDMVYRCTITSDGFIQFGPGSSTALDMMLKRISSSALGVMNAGGSSYQSLALASTVFKTASNDLILTSASIATANRTITMRDPGADVDAAYLTSGATATAGGLAYGTGSQSRMNVGAQGTSGQAALSGGSGAPTWGTLGTKYGGTNVDGSAAANGTLLIGNGSGYTLATITAGSGISITNGSGTITIASTGTVAFTPSAKSGNFENTDASGTFYLISATATITLDSAASNGTVHKFQRTSTSAVLTFVRESSDVIRAGSQYSLTSFVFDNDGCLEAVKTSTGWSFT